jgi:hypothetical protein
MAGFRIEGNVSGNVAEVDSNNQLKTNLPVVDTNAGFAAMLSEVDDGTVTGSRYVKAPELTEDYRLRVGVDTILFNEQFPGASLNTTLWSQQTTTMTITLSGGNLVLNAGNSVATTVNARVTSYQHFPLIGTFPLWVQICAQFPQTPQTNNVSEWGLGIATGTSAPTDGVFFRLNASGEFRGVVNFNGTETQSGTLDFATLVGTNTVRKFVISCSEETAEFWIDDQLVAEVNAPAAQGVLTSSPNLPVLLRTYNSNTTSAAQQIKVGQVNVSIADAHTSKAWEVQQAGMGRHSSQGQTGQTLGTTANYANSANPTAAVPTNTTAALGSGLGGQFWETDTLAVTTDGIISSYQNPAGTSTAPGRVLYITRVYIASYVQTALTGGPYIAQWSLAYGHTAVSLATTDGAGTKAPRRIALGIQPVTSGQAISTIVGTPIDINLAVPIVVYPGEFIQTVKKKVGTAPSAGVIAHVIAFGGFWE